MRGSVRPLVQDFAISLPGGLVKHAAKGSKKRWNTSIARGGRLSSFHIAVDAAFVSRAAG